MSFDVAMERNFYRGRLIALVRANPLLWDKTTVDFNNRMAKMQKWLEVSAELRVSTDKIRRTWENLRDQFRRDLKRQLKYGTRSKWRFYDDMSFIRSMVRVKELNGACNSESESEELDTLQDEYEHDNLSGIVMETNLTTPMPDLDDQPSTSATAAAITEMPNYLPIQLSTEWQQLTGDMSRMERQNYQREQIECRQLQEQARQEYDFMRHKQQMQQYQKRQQHKQQHRQHKLQQLELQKHLEVQEQQKLQERQQQQQKQQRRQQQQQQQLELQQQQIQQHQQERQQQTQLQQHKPQKPHLEDPQEPQQKCDSSDETKFDADFHAELPEMVKIEIESDSDDQDCMSSLHLAVVASPEMIIPTIDHRDASLSEEVCVTTSASTSSNAPKRSRSAEESSEIKAEYAIKHVRLAQSQQEREVPDEDYHFVMSILPSLRQISRSRKFPLRMSIMDMISKELESDEQD